MNEEEAAESYVIVMLQFILTKRDRVINKMIGIVIKLLLTP